MGTNGGIVGTSGRLDRTGTGPVTSGTCGVAVGTAVVIEAGGSVADGSDVGDGEASPAEAAAEGDTAGSGTDGVQLRTATVPTSTATAAAASATRLGGFDELRT
jgi:hypothetical protein